MVDFSKHLAPKYPKVIGMWTDIHFGRKGNAILHNQDCLDFVTWSCDKMKAANVDMFIFMGDWFENRHAVNVMTMSYAIQALKLLDELDVPIVIIIGNHDLYHRENRKVFSTKVFEDLRNVTLVSEPTVINGMLICPYMFKSEYPSLAQYTNLKYWFGHFEFKNFVMTGSDTLMDHGPDHTQFGDPKYIFSGHFHKRQMRDNTIYIGNCFPMDYGDQGDDERGMAFLNTDTDEVWFENWEACPTFRKTKLSKVLAGDFSFPPKCRVKCSIDTEIHYSDAQALREAMVSELNLREFVLEENMAERKNAIAGDDDIESFELDSLNEAVIKLLKAGVSGTSTIDADKLVGIYEQL